MRKDRGLIVHTELLDENRYKQEMEENDFILMHDAADLMDISVQTLSTICALYDIEQYRLRTRFIMIRKSSLMKYLDEHHYIGKTDPEDKTVIFDYRGERNNALTYVKEKHTDIEQLHALSTFAEKINLGTRRVMRYCDHGIFRHYRINSTYKVSQADVDYNVEVLKNLQFRADKRLAIKPRKKRATKAEMELRAKKVP